MTNSLQAERRGIVGDQESLTAYTSRRLRMQR
jgi:hypothetical protein